MLGDMPMFETPKERVKLLKAGIDGITIEKLYILYNNFKLVLLTTLFDGEIEIESNGLTYETDENHYGKQNSLTGFPHLLERFSMVGIHQFLYGFKLFLS
jgi:hypothetical protein